MPIGRAGTDGCAAVTLRVGLEVTEPMKETLTSLARPVMTRGFFSSGITTLRAPGVRPPVRRHHDWATHLSRFRNLSILQPYCEYWGLGVALPLVYAPLQRHCDYRIVLLYSVPSYIIIALALSILRLLQQ